MKETLHSHVSTFHIFKEGRCSIPIPIHGSGDLPKGLISAILKQAGIKE